MNCKRLCKRKSDGSGHVFATSGAEYVGFMQDTINSARGNWSNYQADFQQSLTDYLQTNCLTVSTRQPFKSLKRSAHLRKKRKKNLSLKQRRGVILPTTKKTEEDLRLAKIDYDKIRAELNRPLATKFEKIYIPFLIVRDCRGSLNRSAFLLYFDGIPSVVLALALAVGGMLVFLPLDRPPYQKGKTDLIRQVVFARESGIGSIILQQPF